MTELNEYECELLDAVLEAFGIPDSLTRLQLLELFDQDEAAAFVMVQVLLREELIAEVGKHGEFGLADKLVLKPKGEKFLKEGGFLKRYRLELERPVEVGGTLAKLQQQNMRLQNLKLSAESERNDLQKRVGWLQIQVYVLLGLMVLAFLMGYLLGHLHKR